MALNIASVILFPSKASFESSLFMMCLISIVFLYLKQYVFPPSRANYILVLVFNLKIKDDRGTKKAHYDMSITNISIKKLSSNRSFKVGF